MTLQLHTLKPDDAFALARLANNRKIWNNVRDRMPFPYTTEHAAAFIENIQRQKNALVYAIGWAGQRLVGTVGLHLGEEEYRGTAELAYWLGEPFWGQGIASKAVQEILKIGFGQLHLRRIYATVYSFNSASLRVLEKNNFNVESVARQAVMKNGKVADEICCALLAREYQPQMTTYSAQNKTRFSRRYSNLNS